MKNIVRSFIALCLFGTVACPAALRNISVTLDIKQVTNGTTANSAATSSLYIHAAGTNGTIRGKGQFNFAGVISYPLQVTSGAITVGTANGTTVAGTTLTLNGFIKPRTGPSAPFIIVTDNSGLMTMTITTAAGANVLIGQGKVKLTF